MSMDSARRRIEIGSHVLFIALLLCAPLMLDPFWLNRSAKFLVYGLLGIAISLSWGYAGILNLGQGLFFGLGAYMMAFSLKLASPTSLQQGSTTPVPDFMLGNAEPGARTDLCCINDGSFLWIPFQHTWFGMTMALLAPTLVAACIGWVMFRQRISGVFVAIIMLALALLVRLLVVDAQPVTNGFNGLTDLGDLVLFGVDLDPYSSTTYLVVAVTLSTVLVAMRLLLGTRAGLVLQALGSDADRARTLGYEIRHYQTFFLAVSAFLSGLAGLLYVVVAQFASPTFMDLSFSITMVVWAAVGGRASLLGACLGAIVINLIEAGASESQALVQSWRTVIGLIFVLVVIYLPRGLAGLAGDLRDVMLRTAGSRVARLRPGRQIRMIQ